MADGAFYAKARCVMQVGIAGSAPVLVAEVPAWPLDGEAMATKIAELLEADRRKGLPLAERQRLNGRDVAGRMSPEARRERAQKAAAARWGNDNR